MIGTVKRFIRDESGATAIEYGVIAAVVAVVCIIALQNLGQGVIGALNVAGTAIGSTT